MPRKNKRRFFGKSNKSKSTKQSRNETEPQNDSDSDENASAQEKKEEGENSIASATLVPNDSLPTMGQLESVTSAETPSATSKQDEQQHKATIKLKVIQFVGELPKETRGSDDEKMRQENFVVSAEISGIENDDNDDDNKSVIGPAFLQGELIGDVPEFDRKKNEKSDESRKFRKERSFDDNYRVESPKQICIESGPPSTKRHAMLIQEISENSSSEEVKQFLDCEAVALEMKVDKPEGTSSPRDYRVESPESSDESSKSKVLALREEVTVQEISESSSSDSVKNEILASIARKSPPTQRLDTRPSLKIINIKELPSEDGKLPSSTVTSSSSSRIIVTQFECKTEKKLNKAEEAILKALYGNKSLLQIPNLPLDVISEEGSDCGSDADKQLSSNVELDDDDDVFLPLNLSKKPPSYSRRIDHSRREVIEHPQLINTKIIETESNIPEGFSSKSWETAPIESELQAELVYLTSTSSSATDLSERGDITDTEDVEDTSEDTETNSLLENISVPSLDEIDAPIEMRMSQPSPVYSSDFYQEINETKLPDILEEDEDQAPKSLEIFESQQQIEDVNKELYQLVSNHERKHVSEENERQEDEDTQVVETICDIEGDKKIISDNDKAKDDCLNRVTPTFFKRKNSSDSSSSSNNSQCTIIRQLDQKRVDALKDLCVQSLNQNGFTLTISDNKYNKDMNINERIMFQKRLNSPSRNAPHIPIIDELELHYKRDDSHEGRENSKDRVITILQVPPEINRTTDSMSPSKSIEKERWVGVQSSSNPNVIVALSPLQKSFVMNSQNSNTSADILLDMHKKFVERRAYHETEEIENSDDSRKISEIQLEHVVDQLEDGYFGDRESSRSVENLISPKTAGTLKDILSESESSVAHFDNENVSTIVSENVSSYENTSAIKSVKSVDEDFKMNSIRNCLLRDEFFKNTFVEVNRDVDSASLINLPENFELKKFELEKELKRLDNERRELEDELKNLQSLQHFKREEFLFNEKKLQDKLKSEIENHSSVAKYANDDFNEFVYSNEKLQQELYNEWQDKVLERNERKMQKTIKITSITESIHHDAHTERASSEILKVVPLENEFMSKLKERQKRLSLPFEVNSSTESLHHQNEEDFKKIDSPQSNKMPPHLHEFLKYYEEEIAQRKSPEGSGIWSECNRSDQSINAPRKSDSPPPPVWTPKSAPQSPNIERKFRPVPFESPTLPRRNLPSNGGTTPPPWTQPNYPDKPYQPSIIKSSSWNAISRPKTQIIYRKARAADQINDKVEKSLLNSSSQKEKSISFKTKPHSPVKSNEIVITVKKEFNSSDTKENKIDDKRKMTSTQAPPKKSEGAGPNPPVSMRSEMTDMNREQWYKKMYNTIHKAKDDDNYVTVKYKTRRGIPYKSNGYASEPDANYDSDYVVKYQSIDRKRTNSIGNQNEEKYGSYEQPVKQNVTQYKIQPGKIEHYTPGKSSVSDKEAKQWWEDVMEIFDGHLEQQKLSSNYTQGNMSRALKDQGYQSDSTLVFKKRSDVDQLSPVEQKQAYKNVLHGKGEVPLHGFRKPLPERPKVSPLEGDQIVYPPPPPPLPHKNIYPLSSGYDSDSQKRYVENDVNIHYKIPVRYEYKQHIPDDELAYQQAEHMKKVYQEERRRKYLQELQDMSNRRHTDNFTPSQKSPIALNRYDDFGFDLPTSKSPVNLPGTVAKALYSFQGQSARELSFKKGDIIYIRRQIDKNWYEGEHNATYGLLPVQYVDIISNDGTRPVTVNRKPTEGQARAKFNFVAQSDIELSLSKGELVTLTRLVDNNWFEGRIGNRKGIFPVSYVDVLADIGSDDLENTISSTLSHTVKNVSPSLLTPNSDIVRETKTTRKTEVLHVDTANEPIQYRAVFNYRPVNSDELELRENDIIYVLEQCDDGWFVGTNSRNGFFGTFPGNYVRRVY